MRPDRGRDGWSVGFYFQRLCRYCSLTYDFITYNHLNLPSVISYTNGNSIEFIYDAAGMKLRKIVKVGATVQYEQSYLGGLEYRKNGTGSTRVEAVYHAEVNNVARDHKYPYRSFKG